MDLKIYYNHNESPHNERYSKILIITVSSIQIDDVYSIYKLYLLIVKYFIVRLEKKNYSLIISRV